MSEKYYREINTNKDIVKFKLQLGAILLKLNEHNSNISNIKDDITKINTDIKNINSDIENIEESNKNIIKHNYAIENIWIHALNIANNFTITSSKVTLFEYTFQGEFIVNSILEISCNILYKYDSYNDIGLLKHVYKLIDENDNDIYQHIIIHSNSGDNYTNHLTMNDTFNILFQNNNTSKLKLNLSIDKVDINNTKSVGLAILNPYYHNTLRIKHIKCLTEK